MGSNVIELFPSTGREVQHRGLYLDQDLRTELASTEEVFVYANFITSIDGRIAAPDNDGDEVKLATQITNARDWRLFQELAVQADVLISSGRYLREYERGPKQELLQVYDDPEFEDLGEWRKAQGLPLQPGIAVVSRSLDFTVPIQLQQPYRSLYVFTTEGSDPVRRDALRSQGATVIVAGESAVSGNQLVSSLVGFGHRFVYSAAGPQIFHMLLASGTIDRLYLTIAHRILGGDPFASIVDGALLLEPANFSLRSLYYDPDGPAGAGQLHAAFDQKVSER